MELVTEKRPGIPESDLFHRMTLVARRFYRKSRFAVMTGSARTAALHLRHGKPLDTLPGREYAIMAICTLVDSGMKLVAEQCRASLLHCKADLFGCRVTAFTIPFYRECQIRIMAGTA